MSDQPAHPIYPGIQIVPRDALERVTREWNTTPPPDLDEKLADILDWHVGRSDTTFEIPSREDTAEAVSRIKALFGVAE